LLAAPEILLLFLAIYYPPIFKKKLSLLKTNVNLNLLRSEKPLFSMCFLTQIDHGLILNYLNTTT
jgi:hypothetical protein